MHYNIKFKHMSKLSTLGGVLLIFLCLLSVCNIWQKAPPLRTPEHHNDELSLNETALAPVRTYIPRHQIVCYAPLPTDISALGKYYMTEYALTPAILAIQQKGCSLTLKRNDVIVSAGVLRSPAQGAQRVVVIRDFGNVQLLLHARDNHQ